MKKIPCVIMRGGTSRAIFFHEADLPQDRSDWDDIFLKAMGSPDPKQIDGLGGAVSSTSKVAVIKPSQRPGIDVDYTFAQVVINKPIVDYRSNCGNISSAVGPFAVDEGLVKPVEPVTEVKIYNTNTNKVIIARVPVSDGKASVYGDCKIDGIPGTSAQLQLVFRDPAGSVTGKLLPTGKVLDSLAIPGFGEVKASIIDAANPAVFVRAEDVGLTGKELPDELNSRPEPLSLLEKIRSIAAQEIEMVENWQEAKIKTPAAPKIAFFTRPADYQASTGSNVGRSEMDICARIISLEKLHKTYVLTGAIATAVAAKVKGSLVNISLPGVEDKKRIVIGHPGGLIPVEVKMSPGPNSPEVEEVMVIRTARRLMEGFVCIQKY